MKGAIRKEILEARNGLTLEDRLNLSGQIKNSVLNLEEYKRARTILCYMPINNEVDTISLIQISLDNGKIIALPRVNKKTKLLEVYEIRNLDEDLKKGSYDIQEPKINRTRRLEYSEIDLIIVPGIVFDLHGFRIGYGEGYYDRLLKSAGVPKIGLAYEFQMRDKLPKESHDVCVDKIITENRIIECGGELK